MGRLRYGSGSRVKPYYGDENNISRRCVAFKMLDHTILHLPVYVFNLNYPPTGRGSKIKIKSYCTVKLRGLSRAYMVWYRTP
jgi:hypothetical protein